MGVYVQAAESRTVRTRRVPVFLVVVLLHVLAITLVLLPRMTSEPTPDPAPDNPLYVVILPQDASLARIDPVPVALQRPTISVADLPQVDLPPDVSAPSAITISPPPAGADTAGGGFGNSSGHGSGTIQALAMISDAVVVYPKRARRRHEQGITNVKVLIDVDGSVKEASVYSSSGNRELDEAAVQGVYFAKFRPRVENGVPRPAYGLIQINFWLYDPQTGKPISRSVPSS